MSALYFPVWSRPVPTNPFWCEPICVCFYRCEPAWVLGAGCVQLHDSPAERGQRCAVRGCSRGHLPTQHNQRVNQEQPGENYSCLIIHNVAEMSFKDSFC